MKKRIFAAAIALCLLAGSSAFAQEMKQDRRPRTPMTAEQIAQKRTDEMKQKLQLNDEQTKQIYNHNLEQAKKMQGQREQMREAHKAEMEKMKSVLTPEQFKQWREMQGAQMEKRAHRGAKMQGAACKGAACDKQGQVKEVKK